MYRYVCRAGCGFTKLHVGNGIPCGACGGLQFDCYMLDPHDPLKYTRVELGDYTEELPKLNDIKELMNGRDMSVELPEKLGYKLNLPDIYSRLLPTQKKIYDHWDDAYRYALGDHFDTEATTEYQAPPQTYDCAGCNKQTNDDECISISYPSTGDRAEMDCFCPSCAKGLLVDISYRKKHHG